MKSYESFNLPHDMEIEILYEHSSFLVVNKPPGVLTQRDRSGNQSIIEILKKLKIGLKYVAPVHRLDRLVSGALLVALNKSASVKLTEEFREHTVEKRYWAIVEAKPPHKQARLEHRLLKDSKRNITKIVNSEETNGVPSVLYYRILQKLGKDKYLLEVEPITGFSHQIRVQLSAIGSPIVGDEKYGAKHKTKGFIALHCRELIFPHPETGKRISVIAPLPRLWDSLLK